MLGPTIKPYMCTHLPYGPNNHTASYLHPLPIMWALYVSFSFNMQNTLPFIPEVQRSLYLSLERMSRGGGFRPAVVLTSVGEGCGSKAGPGAR